MFIHGEDFSGVKVGDEVIVKHSFHIYSYAPYYRVKVIRLTKACFEVDGPGHVPLFYKKDGRGYGSNLDWCHNVAYHITPEREQEMIDGNEKWRSDHERRKLASKLSQYEWKTTDLTTLRNVEEALKGRVATPHTEEMWAGK